MPFDGTDFRKGPRQPDYPAEEEGYLWPGLIALTLVLASVLASLIACGELILLLHRL